MLLIHRPAAGEFAPYFSRYIDLVPGEDLLRALRDGAEGTRQLLEPLSESRGDSRYAEGKWTVKDVLGHVADTERVFAYRALRFARNDETPLPGFDQDQWTAVTSTAGRTLQSFREELRAVRDASLALFANLDEAAWHRAGSANNVRMSVRALAFVIAGHEIHHQNVLRERYLA
ncbi:MAG TPA: DinB family protein [Candidatus Limnocylindrales bacterium]|nr:DinB family protein [Candidatus Limnocylindrales bacterium]